MKRTRGVGNTHDFQGSAPVDEIDFCQVGVPEGVLHVGVVVPPVDRVDVGFLFGHVWNPQSTDQIVTFFIITGNSLVSGDVLDWSSNHWLDKKPWPRILGQLFKALKSSVSELVRLNHVTFEYLKFLWCWTALTASVASNSLQNCSHSSSMLDLGVLAYAMTLSVLSKT